MLNYTVYNVIVFASYTQLIVYIIKIDLISFWKPIL
uniref:Uncharacterized protein n=1 Tax=viral metagenome TaxID=1070528 RepID=A0A6C0IUF8_9ZZZZ